MDAGEPLTPHEQIKVISESKLIPLPKTKRGQRKSEQVDLITPLPYKKTAAEREKSAALRKKPSVKKPDYDLKATNEKERKNYTIFRI